MVLQLLVRDAHQQLTILPSSHGDADDDIISITKPLHLSLPSLYHPHTTVNTIAASHDAAAAAAAAPSASSSSSPLPRCPSIPLLPLDTLLLISSFLSPASLCVLTSVCSAFLSVFLHPSHWKQLADSLGYRRNFPLERTAHRSFVLSHHNALCLAQVTFNHLSLFLSPLLQSTLRAPLPVPALHRYEQRVGFIFPTHLRAALLVHDGQEEEGAVGSGWVEGCRLLSGLEIVEEWESRRRREREEGDTERGEGSLQLLAVTSVSGVNRFLLSVDGSVWMETGRLRRRQQVSDQWLHLIASLLPQRWTAQQLTHYTAVHCS